MPICTTQKRRKVSCTKYIDGFIVSLLENSIQISLGHMTIHFFFSFIHNCIRGDLPQWIYITVLNQIRRALLEQTSHSAWLTDLHHRPVSGYTNFFHLGESKQKDVLIALMSILSMGQIRVNLEYLYLKYIWLVCICYNIWFLGLPVLSSFLPSLPLSLPSLPSLSPSFCCTNC